MTELLRCPIVATVTPFRRSGVVDLPALSDYLGLLKAVGVESILVNGTTGEFASLTVRERIRVAEHCRGGWSGRLVVHVGSCAVADAAELGRHASAFADGVAVMNPYFYAHACKAGMASYFAAVLPSCTRPTLLYNFPRHTQAPIPPYLVAQLVRQFPQVIGVKDSGKDRAVTREYRTVGTGFGVYVGDDRVGARIGELGAAGVVTGAGGPIAEIPVAIAAAVATGDIGRAQDQDLQDAFDYYTDARKRSSISDIAFAKAATAARLPGFPTQVRPPLVAASTGQMREIHAVVRSTLTRYAARGLGG